MKSNVLIVVSAVFLAAMALAGMLVWYGTGDTKDAGSTEPSSRLPQPTPDPSTLDWVDVTAWQSSGNDESPRFHISAGTWRVMWHAPHDGVGDGSFAVDVYNSDGTYYLDLYDTADHLGLKFDGPLRGTLGIDGPGDFFLRLRTARDYEVTVQELR